MPRCENGKYLMFVDVGLSGARLEARGASTVVGIVLDSTDEGLTPGQTFARCGAGLMGPDVETPIMGFSPKVPWGRGLSWLAYALGNARVEHVECRCQVMKAGYSFNLRVAWRHRTLTHGGFETPKTMVRSSSRRSMSDRQRTDRRAWRCHAIRSLAQGHRGSDGIALTFRVEKPLFRLRPRLQLPRLRCG